MKEKNLLKLAIPFIVCLVFLGDAIQTTAEKKNASSDVSVTFIDAQEDGGHIKKKVPPKKGDEGRRTEKNIRAVSMKKAPLPQTGEEDSREAQTGYYAAGIIIIMLAVRKKPGNKEVNSLYI